MHTRSNIRRFLKALAARGLLLARNLCNPFFRFEEVAILAYHSISDVNAPSAVPAPVFQKHLAHMAARGYAFISLADCVAHFEGKKQLPRKAVAITFDDGYADFESTALPILERFHAPATVFVVGDPEASRARLDGDTSLLAPGAIERLRKHPLVEIGYHSKTHRNLAQIPETELDAEVAPRYGARYFAHPSGKYAPQVTAAIKRAGYEAAFTIKPGLLADVEDRYFFLRNVMTQNLAPADITLRITKAITWYRKLQNAV